MTNTANLLPPKLWPLPQSLGDAVSANWADLMPNDDQGLIHIEYQRGPRHPIESLIIWASTKWGYWSRVGDYTMQANGTVAPRLQFFDTDGSSKLACAVDAIMEHQEMFSLPPSDQLRGTIQVYPPGRVLASPVAPPTLTRKMHLPNKVGAEVPTFLEEVR